MPFRKGRSGNPAGRPPGSFRPMTMMAHHLLYTEAEALIRRTIEHAKKGNGTALRICWDHLAPRPTDPHACEPQEMAEVYRLLAAMLRALNTGELKARRGSQIVKDVEAFKRMITRKIDAGLIALKVQD